ncbi:MAG: recombinase family protein [Lachnospiraceae bacterium]|nr:recombinase family protein [Butyrivibrio sp.]MCM1343914.1 recombinase family protein [Muribaculaceae bacterium]MCM1408926.1 recombinase family protein [Lachnospiraceae bacterium]
MIREIEAGRIDCVVVKDLSRFGRNFVEAGRYIDQIFPALGVRFIAVNDGFDSARGRTSSDRILVPFKNLINDAYCRDISVKVRSQLETKRKKGDFIGSFAVYGYRKDPMDRHKLVVDEYAAGVVKDIFKWKLEGASQQRIADRLNERGVLSPMEYKRFCGMRYQSGFQVSTKAKWTAVAVGRILRNELYIGTMVQGKRTTPNHKVKKTVLKPSEEWVRVEGSHEPIINREDFQAVECLLLQDTRVAPNEETVYLLSGLAFCGDCGQSMVRNSVSRNGRTYVYYMCGNNRTNGKCSSHRINSGQLEESVFLALQQHIAQTADIGQILDYIDALPYHQAEVEKADRQLVKKQEEAEKYSRLKTSLYESLVDGLMDKGEYLELKALYDGKLQEAQAAVARLREEMEDLLQNRTGGTYWIEQFKKHQNLTELTRHIAVTLIERIDVFEDCRIRIRFKYQDSFERALSLIEGMGMEQPPHAVPEKGVSASEEKSIIPVTRATALGEEAV